MAFLDHIAHWARNIPIRKKILLIVLVTMSLALLLASVVAILFDRQAARDNLEQEVNVLARVIAQRSTAALTFGDRHLALENLNTLAGKNTVVNACIYDDGGVLFAEYLRKGNTTHPCNKSPDLAIPGFSGRYFSGQYFTGHYGILLDGADIGSVYIKVSLEDINAHMVNYVISVLLIFLVVGTLAFLLAMKLQKVITRPIDDLVQASRRVSRDRDYTLRVEQTTNDEIGQLMVAFNVMLGGIQRRDAALVDAKENLEEVVKERTRELREAQNELVRSERMATLGQLTATVSHELRNPLGTIRTSVFTLANRMRGKDPSLNKTIERIERNIVRCDSIITELLDFSRIRALHHEKTNLNNWLRVIVDELHLPESIVLRLEMDKSIDIEVDRDLLRRVVVNVLENAMQAMLEMDDENRDHTVVIQCSVRDSRTEIVFTDTGPGMDDDVLQHIFEPLFSTRSFGVGLGLSVVKQVMEQHGGGVEVFSEKGVGTRVLLWLPSTLNFSSQKAS